MGQGFESLLVRMVGVAQLVAHLVVAQVVEGSSPFTHPFGKSLFRRPDAWWSFAWDETGSSSGPLAQLVEQLTLNQRVRSSILRRPFF